MAKRSQNKRPAGSSISTPKAKKVKQEPLLPTARHNEPAASSSKLTKRRMDSPHREQRKKAIVTSQASQTTTYLEGESAIPGSPANFGDASVGHYKHEEDEDDSEEEEDDESEDEDEDEEEDDEEAAAMAYLQVDDESVPVMLAYLQNEARDITEDQELPETPEAYGSDFLDGTSQPTQLKLESVWEAIPKSLKNPKLRIAAERTRLNAKKPTGDEIKEAYQRSLRLADELEIICRETGEVFLRAKFIRNFVQSTFPHWSFSNWPPEEDIIACNAAIPLKMPEIDQLLQPHITHPKNTSYSSRQVRKTGFDKPNVGVDSK
jgi:hypothetical protein